MAKWKECEVGEFKILRWENEEIVIIHTLAHADFRKDKNIKILKDMLNIKALFQLTQIHGSWIYSAEELDLFDKKEGDGLYTTGKNIALLVLTADCLPLVIYHPNFLMLLHVGWRGLKKGIVKKAIKILKRENLNLENTIAVLGPCIGPCCYEVKHDMIQELSYSFHIDLNKVIIKRKKSTYFNLPLAVILTLKEEKIGEIFPPPACTCCNCNFHSYRREKNTAARAATLAWMKE